jgi:hypothetical protein
VASVLRVVPVVGETTWSFLNQVAAAYGMQAADLAVQWQSANRVQRKDPSHGGVEVLLDVVAQEELAGWCGVPAGHLARALPSWAAGPAELAGREADGGGWMRWRTGVLEWGPVVAGCGLCAARRGAGGRVWVYGPQWRRLCVRHGRWLLEPGEGHPLERVEVGLLAGELGRAQRRWARVARTAREGGVAPREVFALARAVVCWWWEREELWAREVVWGPRLEHLVAAAVGRVGDRVGWGFEQWRLLMRDAVVFPEVVAVARALVDPRLQEEVGAGAQGLLRDRAGTQQFAAVLGARLGRTWLAEVEGAGSGGPLTLWVGALVRQRRGAAPLRGRGMWWVHGPHRPVEAAAGLPPVGDGPGAGGAAQAAGRAAVAVRSGHGLGLVHWRARLFEEGLEHARRHVERFGHLALAHTATGVRDGFDLGRWLAYRRARAALLPTQQAAQLAELDAWWNPPWPVAWQRGWYRARDHVGEHGLVHGGDNLEGLPGWLGFWLRQQITHYWQLHEGQQRLLAELGLSEGEVRRFYAWPGRRLPVGEALAVAGAFAARHGHLAVSGPTIADGFALGAWLTGARLRQRQAGGTTRLGQRLAGLDAWWNPPWPIAWQRMWWAARYHWGGLPEGVQWWPGAPNADHAAAWLHQQTTHRALLQPAQNTLVDELIALAGTVPGWRPRISDRAWPTLSALLPPLPRNDSRFRSERQILEAIVHIACTGQPWAQLPEVLGDSQACRVRYKRWLADGTLARLAGALLPDPDTVWQQRLAAHLTAATSR